MTNTIPKHMRGIFSQELYARIVELSENGADYSETLQILRKEQRLVTEVTERNIYKLFQDWACCIK